jgi:hypothetical protein
MLVKPIGTAVHLAATFAQQAPGAVPMFAKPGEHQPAAVKRYMAWRRREWRAADRRCFPAFKPGVTSVAAYARAFYLDNHLGEPDHLRLSLRPQGLHDDTVTVETIEADTAIDHGRLLVAHHFAQHA